MIRKFISDLKEEFGGYGLSAFSKDLMAGLTTCAVALPLALAFGVSSGATASAGLITAIIAGCLTCALGGAFYQISGPTGAMAAILMSLVATYGIQGVFAATFIAGILLILAGIFKVGRLASFIPGPVIAGFTSGIALIIALGQLDNFFGVTSVGSSTLEKIASYFTVGFEPKLTSVLVGLCVIVFMFVYPKKWNAVMPSSLVSIILATAVCILFDIEIPSVGAIPQTIIAEERFSLFSLNLSQWTAFISPAISIAALGMIESLLCGASAGRMTGKLLDNDRELVAQGISNAVLPFFGGIPSTAAIARTSVAIKSGARTRLAGILHAVFLLVSMLVLAPIMSRIPLASLAGVLIVTAWRMNEWETIGHIFKNRLVTSMIVFSVTMVSTILFDLTVAIVIGIVLTLIIDRSLFPKTFRFGKGKKEKKSEE